MDFCHIAPTPHLDLVKNRRACLTLAHLIDENFDFDPHPGAEDNYDASYTDWYKNNPHEINIMDNSGFELYKTGQMMYPGDQLVDLASKVNATHIVIPDHPDHPSMVGIDEARRYAPVFKEAGFGTFFVPQSTIGDLEDLLTSFAFAASNPYIDYIGVSILAVPNAYKCESGNKLQRFLSRWKFMNEIKARGLLSLAKSNGKKIHFLGMVDGPNEIALMRDFPIDTWDSSASVWAGLNGISFDESPTGLFEGKFEKHVDFNAKIDDPIKVELAKDNINYIDELSEAINEVPIQRR